ncbi:hypothetical protein C7S20_19490 [Christiangramia fulva]|uniref:Uncharacterized protein n=1 Tax=Christiangramia fulva TaxID=2126553 RepID=A0A2R3ZAJ9_9FLAO|nr:hypothetical protein [Christiangramia fulva]AVR47260.1 hypothetical protein C7S20_19490 [Christiangramia fulva]
MPNTDDEIYFKAALDLGNLKPQMLDLTKFWDKHNEDIAKAEKAYKDYAKTTETAYNKVNQKIKDNITQVVNEGKSVQQLEKQFKSLASQTKNSFDDKDLKKFNQALKEIGKNQGFNIDFNLSLDDIDYLTEKLKNAQDEFEATEVVAKFFEDKIKDTNLDEYGNKFQETTQKIAGTRKELEDAQKYLDRVNQAVAEYQNRPVSQKSAGTFVDLQKEQSAAKEKVNELTVALAEQEQEFKKNSESSSRLSTDLRKIKDELAKLELEGKRGSSRWEELRGKAEAYQQALNDTNEEIKDISSNTEGLDQLIGSFSALVGVFSAIQGAEALFGSQNEDLKEALIKLNGAIALLNGLQAVQAELAKKSALSTRVLIYLREQYTIATNASATATARLSAALKLSGIGLLIGGIAAAVYYWEDIAKAIGITSEKAKQMNEINKAANDLYGEQIAELKLLTDQVNKHNLTTKEQDEAVKKFNETQGKTLGNVKDYKELEKKLIEQGPKYITYLENKARAEAAYQLAVQKTKDALEKRNSLEETPEDYLTSFFSSAVNKFRKDKGNVTIEEAARQRNTKAADELDAEAKAAFDSFQKFRDQAQKDYEELGITIDETNKKLEDSLKKLASLFEELIKRERDVKTSLIENDREREKQILKDQFQDQKESYAKQIESLELSQEKKLELIKEFNKLYNEETGIAYEDLNKRLKAIDDKYNDQLEKVKLNALNAINEVILSDEDRQRKAIQEKWDNIRKELKDQIDQTNDELKKKELQAVLLRVDNVQEQETNTFDLNRGLDRIERERKTAEAILKIYQANNKDLVQNESVKELQLLKLQEDYLNQTLSLYKESLKDIGDQSLFDELIGHLFTDSDPRILEEVARKLKETFGEEVANQILETVQALKGIKKELNEFKELSPFEKLIDDFEKWTKSVESFARQLAESLGLEGGAAEEFADGVATAIKTTYDSLATIFNAEISQHQDRVRSLEDAIDGVENQLDRERELYEEGYANNYEQRQADLENLKQQKKQEEEELRKAQKRKAALAKAEFLIDTVSQLNNLVTASSNIFKWASKIPFVGVPLAIGLIATMLGAFSIAKVKAFQAIGNVPTYRKGLQRGKVHLSGPTHEEEGFGVYNSKTGEKVSEVENGEDLYALNPKQQRAYDHLLKAMISDSRGEKDLETSIRNHYDMPKMGQKTIQIVERVNKVYVDAQNAKRDAAEQDISVLKEIKDFKETFKNEFEGYKKERDQEIKTWQTPEYFYVKQGNTVKKYRKKS